MRIFIGDYIEENSPIIATIYLRHKDGIPYLRLESKKSGAIWCSCNEHDCAWRLLSSIEAKKVEQKFWRTAAIYYVKMSFLITNEDYKMLHNILINLEQREEMKNVYS